MSLALGRWRWAGFSSIGIAVLEGCSRADLDNLIAAAVSGAAQGHAEMRAGRCRQQVQRGAIGIGQLACDIQAKAGTACASGEKRLEDLAAQIGWDAGAI